MTERIEGRTYEEIRSRLRNKKVAQRIRHLARGEITALPETGESIVAPTKFIRTMDGSNRVDILMEAIKLYTTDPNKGWEKVVELTDDILKELTKISAVQKGAFRNGNGPPTIRHRDNGEDNDGTAKPKNTDVFSSL